MNTRFPIGNLHRPTWQGRTRGFAVLAMSVALVVISIVVTVGAGVVASGEQKASANLVRAQQSGSAADAGIDRGLIYLKQNLTQVRAVGTGGWMNTADVKWASCSASSVSPPCGNGYQNIYDNRWTAYSNIPNLKATGEVLPDGFVTHLVAQAVSTTSNVPASGVFHAVSEGTSADTFGKSLLRQSVIFQPVLAHRPDAPLIAAGTVGLSGTISVVANPNGGGTGVPLSVWSGGNTSQAGSMQSCHIFEYLTTNTSQTTATDAAGNQIQLCPACECPNAADQTITQKGTEGIDVLDVDGGLGANPDSPYFPSDLFQYLFGKPESEWPSVKSEAQVITDCGTLSSASSGLIWKEGDCAIPSNTVVGSLSAPVILVVSNGEFRMNANGSFFGVLFTFAHDGGSVAVKLNGGPTLYGAMISNQNIDTGNGNYTARYDKTVLDNLTNGFSNASRMALVPGSWRDY